MKITKEDYNELQEMAQKTITCYGLKLHSETFSKLKPFTLLWLIPKSMSQLWMSKVYAYANDTHIETALKKIIREAQSSTKEN